MRPLHVIGMHGLGDNIHQRALMRELMKTREVWLETPWPCVYHDLPGLHLINKASHLRTQAKNAAREARRFNAVSAPPYIDVMAVSYPPSLIRERGSVLGAMSVQCGVPVGDFSMKVPEAWVEKARRFVQTEKPILVARPLVARSEWGGAAARNADAGAYSRLLTALREGFYVVSVADIEPPHEWLVASLAADLELHKGELEAEALMGMFSMSSMVYTSSGFAVPLAQAVGTPVVSVFGGYESSWSFSAGARFSPYLGIDTLNPCTCFAHHHDCDRRIDEPSAAEKIRSFAKAHAHVHA